MSSNSSAARTGPTDRRGWLVLVALVALAATVPFVVLITRVSQPPEQDPCDEPPLVAATLLVDLRKPMRGAAPGTVLVEVARRVPTGEELRVYTVTTDRLAPRRFVGGLCRSFDHDDLAVSTDKDSSAETRDCGDLPAQIAPDLREAATDYCAKRLALVRQIDAMSVQASGVDVANAYLMEALEDTVKGLARTASRTLYVYSDMLQHAHWYSHLDLDWTAWRFEDFEAVRDSHDPDFHADRPAGLAVRVLYVPRLGLTDARRTRGAHWMFWQRYFEGVDVKFEARDTLPGFVAATMMDVAGDVSSVVRQREALATWRDEAEASLREIEAEQQAIAAGERDAAAAVERLETGLAELQRTRLSLRAERVALQADFDASREAVANEAAARDLARQDVDTPVAVDCRLSLEPSFEAGLADERQVGDRRTDYGAATVVVSYAVTAQGLTVDDTISVDPVESTATLAEDLDELAADASALVQDWRFAVDCVGDVAVQSRHWSTATFSYRRKCVGAPIPQCWTVRSEVALSARDGESNP
ncbi:MAG: hypothetical protein OXI79_16730 [Gammaproteobacteria bacterium]|nr:hypothetical protein [Gammaproteobacteria bacterium]